LYQWLTICENCNNLLELVFNWGSQLGVNSGYNTRYFLFRLSSMEVNY